MKALIFNIQRYSIHDGNGIRTVVFLKGCPLHCPWCCNPESQSFDIETVGKTEGTSRFSSGDVRIFGKYMTVDEVTAEVEKDMIFYNTSGGGVTLSGGEVLAQSKFSIELLKKLKKLCVDTAIETSGNGSTKDLLEMSKYLDVVLFDLKIMDRVKARDIIGIDMELVKTNIRMLVENHKKVIPRIPLIPGYTISKENIEQIIEFTKELGLREIHILPFHQYGSEKYEYLHKEYSLKDIEPLGQKESNDIKKMIEKRFDGVKVVIGGM